MNDAHHDHEHHHEHDHVHGHDHGHDHLHGQIGAPVNVEELDPANQSLNEALRISFGFLKWIMVLLVVVFIFSGLREIQQNEVGVRLHFGRIQPDVLQGGEWHFAWPEPIDRVVVVKTSPQTLTLGNEFWFKVNASDKDKALNQIIPQHGGLVPGVDGSMLTGDQNIVHGRWTVNYQVDALTNPENARLFVKNVSTSSDPGQMMRDAERFVRLAAAEGLIKTVAQTSADRFVARNINKDTALESIQQALDRMGTGIRVTDIQLTEAIPPLVVLPYFDAVARAESDRAKKIEEARKDAAIALSVAGNGYAVLRDAIDEYELARESGDETRIAKADARITDLLTNDQTRTEAGIGGQVAEIISQAKAYRTQVVADVVTEQNRFLKLYEPFANDPKLERITRNRLWQAAREKIFTGDVETFYIPKDATELYLELNRDPRIEQRKETAERLQQMQQEQAGQ